MAFTTTPPRRCDHSLDLEVLIDRTATSCSQRTWVGPSSPCRTAWRAVPLLRTTRPCCTSRSVAASSRGAATPPLCSAHVVSHHLDGSQEPCFEHVAARCRTWGSPRCQPRPRRGCRSTHSVVGALPVTHTPFEGLLLVGSGSRHHDLAALLPFVGDPTEVGSPSLRITTEVGMGCRRANPLVLSNEPQSSRHVARTGDAVPAHFCAFRRRATHTNVWPAALHCVGPGCPVPSLQDGPAPRSLDPRSPR